VILPTYNEVETAPTVVAELLALDCVDEIVVVDDDSPDGTAAAVATRFVHEPVEVVVRTAEVGLGSAICRGFAAATGDRLVVMDADEQHPPAAVPELVDALDIADVAVGSRHTGGAIDAEWSRTRYAMSFAASCLAWVAVPDARPLQDPMSGCFAARREVVAGVFEDFDPTGYKILLEVLALAPVSTVAEVPLRFDPRAGGESNLDASEVGSYAYHLLRLARESRRLQRPERVTANEVRR